jgi:hypothetical protein
MKKSTLLIAALAILFIGGAIHALFFQPDPYTGVSPAENSGVVSPKP